MGNIIRVLFIAIMIGIISGCSATKITQSNDQELSLSLESQDVWHNKMPGPAPKYVHTSFSLTLINTSENAITINAINTPITYNTQTYTPIEVRAYDEKDNQPWNNTIPAHTTKTITITSSYDLETTENAPVETTLTLTDTNQSTHTFTTQNIITYIW